MEARWRSNALTMLGQDDWKKGRDLREGRRRADLLHDRISTN
jgi:hypothetical protein